MDALAKVCPKCGRRYDTGAAFCQTDGVRLQLTDEQVDPYIGQTLLDQFKIEEKIGAGGMGTVYRARQTTLHRDVAIKILHPELADNRDAVRRFKREARVCTALDHPNVVRVFLFGQLKDGSLYIVMEYLRGRSLLEVIQNEGALPVHRAIHIAAQICDGVGEAHGQGVVHRDLKPENVVLVQRSRDPDVVKVLDFGIARVLWGDDVTQATQSGLVFGTARYISPEGAAGEATDARSDVYSLGIIAYQLLCGKTPFDAPSPVGMLMKHIHSSAPHLSSHREAEHVPPALADAIMRALSKNPEGRFDDGHAFADALRAAAAASGFDVGQRRALGLAAADSSHNSYTPHPLASRSRAEAPAAPRGQRQEISPTPQMREPPKVESETLAGAPNPFGDEDDLSIPGLAASPTPAPRMLRTLFVAFVVGALLVGGGFAISRIMQGAGESEQDAVDVDLLAHQARDALVAERYDEPRDTSVLGLTDRILGVRPQHAEALRLRREAADRLVRSARSAEGDEARALYQRALRFAPRDTDERADIEAAIAELDEPPPPAITPGVRTRPALVVEDQAVTLVAALAPDVEVGERERPRFIIRRGGRAVGRSVEATLGEDGAYTAQYTFARSGDHQVLFRVGRGADRIEDEATIDVQRDRSRPPRPREEDPPPVTTQGSAWTPTIAPAWNPTPDPIPPTANPPPAPEPDPPPPPAPWTGGSVL